MVAHAGGRVGEYRQVIREGDKGIGPRRGGAWKREATREGEALGRPVGKEMTLTVTQRTGREAYSLGSQHNEGGASCRKVSELGKGKGRGDRWERADGAVKRSLCDSLTRTAGNIGKSIDREEVPE